jgi:hypothetical protein
VNSWTSYFNQEKKISITENMKVNKENGGLSRVEVKDSGKLTQGMNITNKGNTTLGSGNTSPINFPSGLKHEPYHEQSLPQPCQATNNQRVLLSKTPPKQQIQPVSNK